jgi:hypothetical protein
MEQSKPGCVHCAVFVLLAAIMAACSGAAAEQPRVGRLSIISPQGNTHLSGGSDLRIALSLVDQDDRPVVGAAVQVELWRPDGDLYANLPCDDRGSGSYAAEMIQLPLRGSSGTWRITAQAAAPHGLSSEVEGRFDVGPSISEIYQERYGFWVEYPRIFGLGTGFHNLHETGGLHFEDWLKADGSGFVLLDNYRYGAVGVTFATLEVHWLSQDFPMDVSSALAVAKGPAAAGLHHQEPDAPLTEMSAQTAEFQGRPAWLVAGQGSEFYVSASAGAYPIEWLIFECPGSDWLWSLVIAADEGDYIDHLRTVRNTFECPATNLD